METWKRENGSINTDYYTGAIESMRAETVELLNLAETIRHKAAGMIDRMDQVDSLLRGIKELEGKND
jgi:hypothetical protein